MNSSRDMLNLAVGPVMMDEEILAISAQQIPYFRTVEFSACMLENEALLKELAGASKSSRTVFLTGSGTAAMEAAVSGLLDKHDKILLVNAGSFGQRFADICSFYKLKVDELKLEPGQALTKEHLRDYNPYNYSAFLINMGETSTGVLHDMQAVSDFCKEASIFLIVDAISSFLADELNMQELGIDALIIGAQKALALAPGLSALVLSEIALERVRDIEPCSYYLNLREALANGQRGQTPFTPAVSTLLQLHARLKQLIDLGGAQAEHMRIKALAQDFRDKLKAEKLPFKLFAANPSSAVTSLEVDPLINAYAIFEELKERFNIWLCPNGGELSSKVIRVGHIGALTTMDNDRVIEALCCLRDEGKLGA